MPLSILVLLLLVPVTRAAEDFTLEPVIKYGSTPRERDWGYRLLTPQGSRLSSANVGGQVLRELPVSANDTGRPGLLSQVRGWGASAALVDVQVLGVSLNPPDGLGTSFSTFPPYFFSRFRYWNGPAAGEGDLRGSSGSLQLTTRVEEELGREAGGPLVAEASVRGSSAGMGVVSGLVARAGAYAAQAGMQAGKSAGPGGAVGAELGGGLRADGGRWRLYALGSDLDAETPSTFSPAARLRAQRGIGVLEWARDRSAGDEPSGASRDQVWWLGDRQRVSYLAPEISAGPEVTHSWQAGQEIRVERGLWRATSSLRAVDYSSAGADIAAEGTGRLGLGRQLELGAACADLGASGTWVSGGSPYPEGAVSGRTACRERGLQFFGRFAHTRGAPSLTNRFGVFAGFRPDPGLRPERVWTLSAGAELPLERGRVALESVAQQRLDAIVTQSFGAFVFGPVNAQEVRSVGVQARAEWELRPGWWLKSATAYFQGEVTPGGSALAYQPSWTEVLSLGYEAQEGRGLSFARLQGRLATGQRSSVAATTDDLPGYGLWDVRVGASLGYGLRMDAGVLDLFDRGPALQAGVSSQGRAYEAGLTASF